MRKVLSFLVLLAASAFAGIIDRRDDPEPTLAPQYAKRYLYHCDEGQKKTEARAWKDHLAIAKEAVKWKAGGKWQPAFDMYMGKDSKDSPWGNSIKQAQRNQVKVHQSNWIFPQSWIYVYCKEKDGKSPYDGGKSACGPLDYAYSFLVKGFFHTSYNIVFCPRYYEEKKSISDIKKAVTDGKKKKLDAAWQWMAYGQSYYHEFMHMPGLVNDTLYEGKMQDVIYPYRLIPPAKYFGTKGAMWDVPGEKYWISTMYLADAYATAATVTYFMEQFKLGDVPTQDSIDDRDAGIVSTRLPDLDAKSPRYKNANLPYDATKEDWSFEGLGLTEDNLPLLYPDSTISEEEVMKLFEEGGGPTAEKPDTPGPAPKTTPYATGTCSLELNQSRTDSTDKTEEYLLEPLIIDNDGIQVGYTEPVTATPDHPYALQSKLEELLQMTPSKDHHGRVDFVLGQQVWDTTQNDDKEIPYCAKSPNGNKKNYKCKFTCGWSGGKSSDGSN